jgi:hypothetical protein
MVAIWMLRNVEASSRSRRPQIKWALPKKTKGEPMEISKEIQERVMARRLAMLQEQWYSLELDRISLEHHAGFSPDIDPSKESFPDDMNKLDGLISNIKQRQGNIELVYERIKGISGKQEAI